MADKKKLFRCDTPHVPDFTIDTENEIIKGFAVIQKGITHDERGEVDDSTLESVMTLGNEKKGGAKSRFGHPNMSGEALGTFLGRVTNFRRDGDLVRADLNIDPTAHETPNGDLANYVMNLAKSDPKMFGASLVIPWEAEYRKDDKGKELTDQPPLIRPTALFAVDVVDDPAATNGFFENTNAYFSKEMTDFLDRLMESQEVDEKVVEFLSRYLHNKKPVEEVIPPKVEVQPERSSAMNPEELKAAQEEIRATAEKVNTPTANKLAMKALSEQWTAEKYKAELFAAQMTESGATPVATEPGAGLSRREVRRYSLSRALLMLADFKEVDGLEGDASREVAKRTKKDPSRFYIPDEILRAPMGASVDMLRASQFATYLNTGVLAEGGYLVQTQNLSMIELLRNTAMCLRMGVRLLTGLVGDVAMPRLAGGATTFWLPEGGTVTKSKQSFGQLTLKPKRYATAVDYSRKLLVQSSEDVEALVRADIAISQALSLDLKIINGLGNENEPMGILNTTGVGNVDNGADGLAMTYAKVVEMETTVAVANALLGTTGYLTNPKVRGALKQVAEISAANAIKIWQNNPSEPGSGIVNSYIARATNQMPSNLTKGNGTRLSAVIFGNWADYIAAYWDGVSTIVDPYTGKLEGLIGVVVEGFADGGIRHPGSFCKSVDAVA